MYNRKNRQVITIKELIYAVLDGTGWVPDDDWVLEERDWYVEGKENDTLTFGEAYFDSMTEKMCMSVSMKLISF